MFQTTNQHLIVSVVKPNVWYTLPKSVYYWFYHVLPHYQKWRLNHHKVDFPANI